MNKSININFEMLIILPQLFIAVYLQSAFETFIRDGVSLLKDKTRAHLQQHEFPNSVNIAVTPDVCHCDICGWVRMWIIPCCVCVCVMTTDCQTNTVKALLITKLLKVQFTSQDITQFTPFSWMKGYSVNTTMHWYCTLNVPLIACSLSATVWW